MGPAFEPSGNNFSQRTALATMYCTNGLRFGKSVEKFIFFLYAELVEIAALTICTFF
jgi:hypothetical protein